MKYNCVSFYMKYLFALVKPHKADKKTVLYGLYTRCWCN